MKHLVELLLILLMIALACPAAGALDGVVVDNGTGAPVPGAIVTVGDRAITSDQAGRFRIQGNPEKLLVRAAGYRATAYVASEIATRRGVLPLTPFTPKALYLSVYGIGSKVLRNSALSIIQRGELNAVVIDLKGDRGLIPYPTSVTLAKEEGSRQVTTISDLAATVQTLHNKGIYTIARIVVFKDVPLATARPDLAVHKSNGEPYLDKEGLAWTDPFRKEVWNYNIAIAVEAARAGFDEVQFDYVRFPDVAMQLRFASSPTEAARTEAIEGFLSEARRQLVPFNVFLAVDIFGYVSWNTNDTGIGQQLEHIIKIVDYLSPMLYPSGFQYGIPNYRNPVSHPYEIVKETLTKAQQRVKVPAKHFRPWIQAFRDYAFDRRPFGEDEVQAQVRAATEFGSDGWMLWNPRNSYEGLFPEPQKSTQLGAIR